MQRRFWVAFMLVAFLAACGTSDAPPTPTPRSRADQIAQLTQVAAAQEASAVPRAATQTVRVNPTTTPTVAPTSTNTPQSTATPTPAPGSRGVGTGTSKGTAIPTATTQPARPPLPLTPGPGSLFPPTASTPPFFDPLTSPASGWTVYSSPEVSLTYQSDGYHMRNTIPGTWLEAQNLALASLPDVSVEVEVTSLTGPIAGNGFGVLCRYQDQRNWYGFVVGSDGLVQIRRTYFGAERILGEEWARIVPGAPARLRADCIGNMLTLSINGRVLIQAQDSALTGGAVELYACTCARRGAIEARFANIIVQAIDPAIPRGPVLRQP